MYSCSLIRRALNMPEQLFQQVELDIDIVYIEQAYISGF
jgi:hypothetical protein